ncbi:MAG: alkaline phosphatase family protein [Candidatus Cybelea sp.]
MTRRLLCAALVTGALAACGSDAVVAPTQATLSQTLPPTEGSNPSNHIRHVVLVIQENRSFDNLFATFPGAEGARRGQTSTGKRVRLRKADLDEACDFGHGWLAFIRDYDAGKMDGFDLEGGSKNCPGKAGTLPYQYVDPSQIAPYWDLAADYVLADHMFQTQGSGSFTAHQDLIAGSTAINPLDSLVDFPSTTPWGCDALPGTTTSLLRGPGLSVRAPVTLKYLHLKGPFPCLTYETMRDLLDAKGVSWKYYTPPEPHGTGAFWDAFDAIKAVRYGPEWKTNVVQSDKAIFTDIANHALPAVSWLIPDDVNSDHPGPASDTGPSWVATVVNTIGESSYWHNTAVIVLWDDWGGFYDNVPPAFFDNLGGLGFRVPMLVISPYAREGGTSKGGYISHTQYEFGSVLRFVEDTFGLGRLGTTDTRATSIVDCFDFTQHPREFNRIPSKYSRAYFERQPPSYEPVDSE